MGQDTLNCRRDPAMPYALLPAAQIRRAWEAALGLRSDSGSTAARPLHANLEANVVHVHVWVGSPTAVAPFFGGKEIRQPAIADITAQKRAY